MYSVLIFYFVYNFLFFGGKCEIGAVRFFIKSIVKISFYPERGDNHNGEGANRVNP